MTQQAGKYARFEFERRFVVAGLPDSTADEKGWRITDRYIKHTHLRLRRMEPTHGGETILKLGQKHVPSPPDFSRMTITNIYLSGSEYAVLAELDAFELTKLRRSIEHNGRSFSVDAFGGHLSGLVLAEVSFAPTEVSERSFDLPAWVIREVSNDIRFTGGALASLSADGAIGLIRQLATPEQ